MCCATQWEKPSMASSRCTLAFTEIEAAMRMHQVRNTVDCFRRVRILLNTARNVFVEQHNAEAAKGRSGG